MKFTQVLRRMTLGLMLASVPMLGGCGSNTNSWQEEVRLLDGRVITITQKRRYENVYDGQSLGNLPREFWVSFKLPELGAQEVIWHENLMPRILNVYQEKVYLVGVPWSALEFHQYGSPNPSYLGYFYEMGNWVRIPFNEIPEQIYNTNLLIAAELPKEVRKVSLARKAEEIANDRLRDMQKRIDPKHVMLNY
jgi:hypothetical protein